MSATFWTMARVAEALRDQLAAPAPAGAATFGSVSTDTRTIAPGSLFVALRGENHDAHDHLADAVAKGATGLVVSDAGRVASPRRSATSTRRRPPLEPRPSAR